MPQSEPSQSAGAAQAGGPCRDPARPQTGSDGQPILDSLVRMGLLLPGTPAHLAPLTGGVASDIYRVEVKDRTFVVKRALDKLRVAADWHAPVERNAYEVAWLKIAALSAPGTAPAILGHDERSGLFAMEYLPTSSHPVWKAELMAGRIDPGFAQAVGSAIAAIHAATAGDAALARRFDTLHIFRPIRLDAYLGATALRHPEFASRLRGLADETASKRIALVHGDVSPKNILVGPHGPVFLDAECAWYGDPAFDLAFCLNHLLLKAVASPRAGTTLLASFESLARAYLERVTWEPPERLERRAAALLPALFLARVDGKSPVEYISSESDKDAIRRVAIPLVAGPPERLSGVRAAFEREWET